MRWDEVAVGMFGQFSRGLGAPRRTGTSGSRKWSRKSNELSS